MLATLLFKINTYLCLVMAVIWTSAYAYSGYRIFSCRDPPKFLVKLWAIFMLLNVMYLFLYLWIVLETYKHQVFIIYLIIVCDILYAVAHWMLAWSYFQTAIDIETIVRYSKPLKKKWRIYINYGFIASVVVAYVISLIAELIKVQKGTYLFGESSTILFVFFGLVTTILLCYAVLRIRSIIESYPHLKTSNSMMSAHLVMFSLNEIVTVIQVALPIILTHGKFQTSVTVAENVNSILLILGQFTIFPLMLFIAYLLIIFTNPVDDISADGKTPTFFARLRGP